MCKPSSAGWEDRIGAGEIKMVKVANKEESKVWGFEGCWYVVCISLACMMGIGAEV